MEKQANQTGQDLSQLKEMFSDFQKKQAQSSKRTSRENILAKYFVPRSTKEIFRILPPKAGRKHVEEAFFHVVTTNAAGGKKKHGSIIYCPAHNDPKVPVMGSDGKQRLDGNGNPMFKPAHCPLCERYKTLIKTQDPSLKGIKKENMTAQQLKIKESNDKIWKEASKWQAKKFYIIRGIDKGAEKDGVKFWRFKHNFKNQGTLDKLLPILEDYMTTQQADFSDPQTGTDLNIIMTDAEFNGHVYKQISAITARGKSQLHSDNNIAQAWLDDDISWRDVFKPKQAPNIPPEKYLELIVEGNSPYWDDTDQNNKRWVVPNHPDLEEAANTRNRTFDADEDNFEQASDLNNDGVTISNITKEDVGKFEDDSVSVGKPAPTPVTSTPAPAPAPVAIESETEDDDTDASDDSDVPDDYDDLPF